MSVENILTKTEEYLTIPAVVRFEHTFMNRLADDFNLPGYDVCKENRVIVVTKKGSKSNKIISAHIDRHGIVVNEDGKFEYAAFNAKKLYGLEFTQTEAVFQKSGARFIDELVYVYDSSGKPLEIVKVKDFDVDFEKKDLFFKLDFLTGLPPNTPIAYVSPLTYENRRVSSQIDNVISVAVVYQLVQDGFDGTAIFATEEECGQSWKHILDYLKKQQISTQELITLDTTPYQNEDVIDDGLVVLRYRDEHGVFNPYLVDSIRGTCAALGMRHHFKDRYIRQENLKRQRKGQQPKKLGTTELGRIAENTKQKINGATIQIPTTNYHTNHETTSVITLDNYYTLLTKILSR